MKRILVIEPSQMLRHAFAVALSPEYEVETSADFTAENSADRAHLVIVNAATLKTYEKLKGNELETARAWRKPIIWIDDEKIVELGELATWVWMPWPIDKDGLRKAVTTCLEKIARTSGQTPEPKKATPPALKKIQRSEAVSESTEIGQKRLIELVDIVE
jgi:hypothetical protein